MQQTTVTVINKAGLHARASAKLAALCGSFDSRIRIGHEKIVDGKSILSLMMLAAVKGTTLTVMAEGDDEIQAVAAIVDLFANRFEEDE